MSREDLLRKITEKAERDRSHRHDRRFVATMGFLVAKGFLRTNRDIPLLPNQRLRIEDAIWAGQNVEPRILEVLPAAVLRLEKHFDLDPETHPELARVVAQLRRSEESGDSFCGMPYDKLRVWVVLPLPDRRMKPITRKKVIKTFRLDPGAIERLRRMAKENNCTETEVVERLLLEAEG